MHGLEHEVRASVAMVLDLDIVKVGYERLLLSTTVDKLSIGVSPRDSIPNRACKRAS